MHTVLMLFINMFNLELEPDMVDAAKNVAKTSKAPENTESDLLKKLKEISQEFYHSIYY